MFYLHQVCQFEKRGISVRFFCDLIASLSCVHIGLWRTRHSDDDTKCQDKSIYRSWKKSRNRPITPTLQWRTSVCWSDSISILLSTFLLSEFYSFLFYGEEATKFNKCNNWRILKSQNVLDQDMKNSSWYFRSSDILHALIATTCVLENV